MNDKELEDLWRQIHESPAPRVQVRLLETLIGLLDARQDVEQGASARKRLFRAAIDAGQVDRALVAFAWLRNQERKQDAQAALSHGLLWDFKWIAEELPYFVNISAEQLESFFEDMHAEFERAGRSLRPVFQHRMMAKMVLGLPEEKVEEVYVEWQSGLRDMGSDCAACERHWMTEYKLYVDGLEAALQTSKSILSSRLACMQVPQRTVGLLLIPLMDAGQQARAQALNRQFYPRSKGRDDLLQPLGAHLQLSALTGALDQAQENLEAHLRSALDNPSAVRRLPFLMGAHALVGRWRALKRPVRLRLRLADLLSEDSSSPSLSAPLREALGRAERSRDAPDVADHDPGVLEAALQEELQRLVQSMDARGNTERFSGALKAHHIRLQQAIERA